MKIMYGARMARQDLLRAVCVLARMLTRWDEMCDKRLLRLVSYINSTLGYRLRGWIGDKGKFLEHHSFSDADFAGCVDTQRSTTGSFHMFCGPFFAIPHCNGQQKTIVCFPFHSRVRNRRHACDFEDRYHPYDGAVEAPTPRDEVRGVWGQ